MERYLIGVQTLLFLWSLFLKESPKWDLLNGLYREAEETLIKAGEGFNNLTHYERASNQTGSIIRKNGAYLEENLLYQSIVELVSFLLTYLLVRFVSKRIYILVFALFFVAIPLFGLFFKVNYFEGDIYNYYFKLAFVLIIKFGVSLIIQFLLIFTGECFNNHQHPKIYGCSMVFGCLGAALASFVPLFIKYYTITWTILILGSLSIFNLFVLIWIPEIVATHDSTLKLNLNPKHKIEE